MWGDVMRRASLPALVATLALACGSEVVVEGPRDDDGPSPPTPIGGNGPQPAPIGGGGATSTSTGPGVPSMKLCGAGHPPCPPSEYCDLVSDNCTGQGSCQLGPDGCDDDCPGVCGCDGQIYCNACIAQSNGTDVASSDLCL
jgi:hypothetical protein